MSTPKQKFFKKFNFDPEKEGYVGIERERFLAQNGNLVPKARAFLKGASDAWIHELSACQVEDRTKPRKKEAAIKSQLLKNDQEGDEIAKNLEVRLKVMEVGAANLPLEVYPKKRYKRLEKDMSEEILRAACRVTGTHIHIGMKNINQAIRAYNRLVLETEKLIKKGDHTAGKRMELYKKVAGECMPPSYDGTDNFYQKAVTENFVGNPQNCWHLIRISTHGTVEVRTFGATENLDEIINWVLAVKDIASF